ncbi:MAG: hypothetical protein CMD31_06960 [Flavobacteriales bacterium]|nr:hypothetical protein [Flavobacteriales bacterium]|tara:strand:- start:32522 stop:36208 length:3687 start_codon:yes stop_codon:yes gene_type:complete
MNYKVFFAYQSDIPEEYGKKFIHDAMNKTISRFKKEGINIELDFGMRKTPGNPLLIDEMLRKSKEADLVLVDLTFTSSKNWFESKKVNFFNKEIRVLNKVDEKKSSNPNALIETGYAWAQKGFNRTVLLMNIAYGSPDELPVDLKGFRYAIPFDLSKNNFDKVKDKRNEFSDDLYNAIKTAINSEADYQRDNWKPLRLHKDWTPRDYKKLYRPTPRIKQIIRQLRVDLENTEIAQRIIGPKNSGKTRLTYELYKEIDVSLPKHDHLEKILYYDLDGGNYISIENKLLDLKLKDQRKIVILDNCSLKIHTKVFNEYFHGTNVSLLSISNDIEGRGGTHYLDEDFAKEIIEKISNEEGDPRNTNFIVENSKGNLRNAIVMIGKIPEGDKGLSTDYQIKWQQILGVELYSSEVLRLLEELSLFTHIGYIDRFQNQSDFIFSQAGIKTREQFEGIINKLAENSIVKITGDFIILEAFVEELAFTRLERLANEDLEEFFKKITEKGMSKQFSQRLVELNKLSGTHQLIEILSRNNGLLSKYEFVSSDQGARIVMNLAEIEPEKILISLENLLNKKTNEDLLKLKKGRRYLVWALERLVFRKETFYGAAKLLYKLAIAENENIGNNATAQFNQLFQIHLPGTKASLTERIELLKELIKENKSKKNIISKALDRALMVHGFMRAGGADEQAGIKLIDYQPVDIEEIHNYWKSIIDLIIELDGYEILVSRIYQQVFSGNADAIVDAMDIFLIKKKAIDKDLRQQFEYILNDDRKLPEGIEDKIQKMLDEYTDDSIREKLEYQVALAPYSTYRTKEGEIINRSEEKAHVLAKQLTEDTENTWLDDIDVLLQGEQRLSFNFGKSIAGFLQDNHTLTETVVNKLKAIDFEKQNNSFLEGYLSGITNQEFIRETIDSFLKEEKIAYHAIRMTRFLKVEITDLEKLRTLITKNPTYTVSLQFMKLDSLSIADLTYYFGWLVEVEPFGRWTAIDLCNGYIDKDGGRINELKSQIKSLIMKEGILKSDTLNSLSVLQYTDLVRLLHNNGGLDDGLVEFLTNEILLVASEAYFINEYHLRDILEILLSEYWDKSWIIIGNKILEPNFLGWYNIKGILSKYKKFKTENLIKWMDTNLPNSPKYVIQFVDFQYHENNISKWSPIVLEMLKKYGSNNEFLDYLSSALHSWSASGSVVPLLQGRKRLVEELLNHDIEEVKQFALREVKYFDSDIKRELRSEENDGLDR